ncbi:MAG: efflux RND transporter periplasmic adaptor subunit [Prevotellaceae bacterium]|jgi:RND family efflux transporter MFP subunit|nr:efflux RND transporter periplasmic adaptor subunit [Prevotellaceae bacterium]
MIHKKIVCWIFILILFACGAKKTAEETPEKKITEVEAKPTPVKTKVLQLQDFNYELISNGTLAATKKAELRFQLSDVIRKIYVKNGDRVSAGQKLAELDRFKPEMAKKQAQEAMERTKLGLADVLISQGYLLKDSLNIPPDVMRLAKIKSSYEQTQNNFIEAEHNLNATTLYAPFGGVIANLKAKEFNLPGSEPFCTLLDNRTLEVIFNVLESEITLVKLNDKIIVSPVVDPAYKLEGRITEINPIVDKNGMTQVKATVNNTDSKLYEGMNLKIRVQRLLGNRLVIPKTALVMRTNKKVVFKLKDNKAAWVYVQTAQENTDSYVVTEGLNAGDVVIYDGNINLADQSPVKVIE